MSEVATRNPGVELVQTMRGDHFKQQVALALPENFTPERFVRIAITALQANPDIVALDHDTIIRELITCAQMGLLPDGNEAALVGYKGKAKLMPMIAGYRRIAAEHGWAIRTAVVYENDEFEYEFGLDAKVSHRPPRPGVDRGDKIAAYAIGAHRDGRRELEVMDAAEIEKIRQVSRAKDSGPWRDWPERMWEKTVGRRIFKKLALDPNDKRIGSLLEEALDAAAGDAAAAIYGGSPALSSPEGELVGLPGAAAEGANESQQATGDGSTSASPVVPGDASAAPEAIATSTKSGASPEGNDGVSGAVDAAEPRVGAPEPVVVEEAFPIPAAAQEKLKKPTAAQIKAAYEMVIPETDAQGAEVLEHGKTLGHLVSTIGGPEWCAWAVGCSAAKWSPEFRRALEVVHAQQEPAA